jgi:hypothetical protein
VGVGRVRGQVEQGIIYRTGIPGVRWWCGSYSFTRTLLVLMVGWHTQPRLHTVQPRVRCSGSLFAGRRRSRRSRHLLPWT